MESACFPNSGSIHFSRYGNLRVINSRKQGRRHSPRWRRRKVRLNSSDLSFQKGHCSGRSLPLLLARLPQPGWGKGGSDSSTPCQADIVATLQSERSAHRRCFPGNRQWRETIFRFVKVRSRGRKVYSYQRDVAPASSKSVKPAPQPADPGSRPQPKPKWEFKYSERYNLTRLSDEEAEARRKKLEEEGH